jgi:hypothetical protein
MVFDRELARGGGREADVEDVAADGLQRRQHRTVKHGPGDAAVASDDDVVRMTAPRRPSPEAGGEFRHDFGCQAFAHASTNAGHAHHQALVRHPTSIELRES